MGGPAACVLADAKEKRLMLAGTTRRITGPRRDREEELVEEQNSSERKEKGKRVQIRGRRLCTGRSRAFEQDIRRWQREKLAMPLDREGARRDQPEHPAPENRPVHWMG